MIETYIRIETRSIFCHKWYKKYWVWTFYGSGVLCIFLRGFMGFGNHCGFLWRECTEYNFCVQMCNFTTSFSRKSFSYHFTSLNSKWQCLVRCSSLNLNFIPAAQLSSTQPPRLMSRAPSLNCFCWPWSHCGQDVLEQSMVRWLRPFHVICGKEMRDECDYSWSALIVWNDNINSLHWHIFLLSLPISTPN